MIRIDARSYVPLYEQIKAQVRRAVVAGELKPDDSLPSIRELAGRLLLNPNTVARAYRELELEGVVYTRQGKGVFVDGRSPGTLDHERRALLETVFDEAIAEADRMGLPPEEMETLFAGRLARKNAGRKGDRDHE